MITPLLVAMLFSFHKRIDEGPNKILVIIVVIILVLGLLYFIYNFYVCHRKKVNLGEIDDEDGQQQQQKQQEIEIETKNFQNSFGVGR